MADFIQALSNDITPVPTPALVHVLQQHTRPIECLAMHGLGVSGHEVGLWSGDSMGRICVWELRRWMDDRPISQFLRFEWLDAHATAVYQIIPDRIAKQVWTASGDNSVLLSSFNPQEPSEAPRPLRRIEHPYFVKNVHLPMPGGDHVSAPSEAAWILFGGSYSGALTSFTMTK